VRLSSVSLAAGCEVKDTSIPRSNYSSLAEAVEKASAGNTLHVRGTCEGDTSITKNLRITSPEHATLEGSGSGSVVLIEAGVEVTIRGLTISGGSAEVGGGIYNHGTLTLTRSHVSDNTATYDGGGIENVGTLTLTHSPVRDNTPTYDAGGVANFDRLTLTDSPVGANTATYDGGGIFNDANAGSLELTSTPVRHNTASNQGGGIYNYFDGPVKLTSSHVVYNTAGAGPGSGGGIYNTEGDPFTFISSTVRHNTPENCNSTLTCPA
jgi:hypothetical protein